MKNISQKRRDFVLKFGKALGIAGVGSVAPQAFAKGRSANIQSVTFVEGDDGQQRVIFKLDKSIQFKVITLSKRIAIDFLNTQSKTTLKLGRNNKQQLIKGLRQAKRKEHDFRVVLDMTEKAKATSKFKSTNEGYFLEVALNPANKQKTQTKKAVSAVHRKASKHQMIIAIDAGHGGNDPGAIGKKGTKEKHIALQIAKRLKKKIDRQPGMKAVLIRNGDYYLRLRKRIEMAHAKKANLFISIHADANPDRKLTGSSVYILSKKGASSEAARRLANNENSYEMKMVGSKFHTDNKVVDSLLLNLSLSDTIDRSLDLAGGVLKELGTVNRLLRRKVESAGFVVLKSPDIPSMLVETAFISNAMEEKRLKTSHHQEKLAKAIFKGIRQYQVASINSDSMYS